MSTASLAKPGTLIRSRGREWVVLPDSSDELLIARPVGGLDEEIVHRSSAMAMVRDERCARRVRSCTSPAS